MLTDEEIRKLRQGAEREDNSVSFYIRTIVKNSLKRKTNEKEISLPELIESSKREQENI
jgi:hypothetical protein